MSCSRVSIRRARTLKCSMSLPNLLLMSTVLIVEDDPVCGRLTCEYVRAGGYQALLAVDGATALVMLREHTVDVVVTDLAMPNLNGLRLIQAIRDSGDGMPIIAMSGTNVDQLDLAEDYGANASVAKPVKGPPLVALLKRVIEDTETDWTAAWIHPEFGSVDRQAPEGPNSKHSAGTG